MKILASILFVLLFSLGLYSQNLKYSKVKIDLTEKNIRDLGTLGIAIDEGFIKKGQYFITDLSINELKIIAQHGFTYEILVDDVSKFYAERNKTIPDEEREVRSGCNNTGNFSVPKFFYYGSMGGYFTLKETMDILDTMRAKFPKLISSKHKIDTLTTVEGRNLYWIKISDNPDSNENEPEVLYTALIHAREPESISQMIFFMYYLLENYNNNPEIKFIVDNTELYFIPCLNPDGYVYNEAICPQGGGMWRKNRKDNGDSTFGIDLNRNFGYKWGYDDLGSSPVTTSETYRGTAGFSEIETQLIKSFCEQHQFKIALNYHTYNNVLICPWGYKSQQNPDSAIFSTFGMLLTEYNGYDYGIVTSTLNYGTNGTQDDWMYGEQSTKTKIYSMTPEIGSVIDGFWPARNQIIPLAQENVQANIYLALFSNKYAKVTNSGSEYIAQKQGYFKYSLQRLGLDTGLCTFTVSVVPVSNNIIGTGASKPYPNLHFLTIENDSISFTLSSNIKPGDEIKYILAVNNGNYSSMDTITKIFGKAQIVFSDNCSNTSKWVTDIWDTTSEKAHSGLYCITDSPHAIYQPGISEPITLLNQIDLHSALYAELTFWCQWDIQKYTDCVQLQISTDNGKTWQTLCGKNTTLGNLYFNEPIYTGFKNTWRQEIINLNEYLGQNISLQFTLNTSTNYWTADGFYFDDVFIYAIKDSLNGLEEHSKNATNFCLFTAVPNPVTDMVNLSYSIPVNSKNCNLIFYNSLGEIVSKNIINPDEKEISISLKNLPDGIYFACIKMADKKSAIQKVIKQ